MEFDNFEKGFINFDGIKGGIPTKSLWFNQRMFLEKINQNRKQSFRICKRFILIGESDFFSTMI